MDNEEKKDNLDKKIIIKTGPNLFLFSIALLLAIFAAYTVGGLVSKKANEKRQKGEEGKITEKVESNISTNKKYSKSIISGKSYINEKEGPTEKTQSIYYFYDDNTYFLQDMAYNEYGTYEVENDELVLYSIFSYMPGALEPLTTLNGKTVAQFEKGYLVFTNKNESGEEYKIEYRLENSNINGGLSNTMSKIQKEIDTKVYCN